MDDINYFRKSKKINEKTDKANKEDKQQPTCLQNTLLYFCNFCENTSIHGLKFFGERQRNIFEKYVIFF